MCQAESPTRQATAHWVPRLTTRRSMHRPEKLSERVPTYVHRPLAYKEFRHPKIHTLLPAYAILSLTAHVLLAGVEDASMYNDPDQTQPDQSPYRQPPPYNQPPQPPYGQPQQEPFGQQPTQYMSPPGQPPYGVPPAPPYAPEPQPKPRRRGRVLWIVLGIIVVLVLVCVGGAIALFSFATNNGATSAVNQYYMAVEQQNYAMAYTYLDTSGIGLNGQSLTQALYIQANQAIDLARGKVSSYSITSSSINSNNGVNTAAITVNVTRNGQSYDVHLQLKQESNGWKIVRTDNI
jgi:hypothetical protein